jgi:hypothetical protein
VFKKKWLKKREKRARRYERELFPPLLILFLQKRKANIRNAPNGRDGDQEGGDLHSLGLDVGTDIERERFFCCCWRGQCRVEVEKKKVPLSSLLLLRVGLDKDDRRVDRDSLRRDGGAHAGEADAHGSEVDQLGGQGDARDGVAVFFWLLKKQKVEFFFPAAEKKKSSSNARDQARREVDGRGGEAHARDRPGDEGGVAVEPPGGADVLACRSNERRVVERKYKGERKR